MRVEGRMLNQDELDVLLNKVVPKAIQYATGYTLNELAYRTRLRFFEAQRPYMTMRNRGFVRKSTRFKRTIVSKPINAQLASFFTQTIDRGTGWAEQPVGGVDRRKRKWSEGARRGKRGQVYPKYRARPEKTFPHIDDKGNDLARLYSFVKREKYYNKPVVVYNNDYGIAPGMIRVSRKPIHLLRKRRTKKGEYSLREGNLFFRLAYSRRGRVRRTDIVDNAWKLVERDLWDIWDENLTKQFSRTISI